MSKKAHQRITITQTLEQQAKQQTSNVTQANDFIAEVEEATNHHNNEVTESLGTEQPPQNTFSNLINNENSVKIIQNITIPMSDEAVEEELYIQEGAFMIVNKLNENPEFLVKLSEIIADELVNKMNKEQQFGYVKKFGKDNKLLKLKEAIDAFIENLQVTIQNEILLTANNLFTKVQNG